MENIILTIAINLNIDFNAMIYSMLLKSITELSGLSQFKNKINDITTDTTAENEALIIINANNEALSEIRGKIYRFLSYIAPKMEGITVIDSDTSNEKRDNVIVNNEIGIYGGNISGSFDYDYVTAQKTAKPNTCNLI